jgi:hypothetical protein
MLAGRVGVPLIRMDVSGYYRGSQMVGVGKTGDRKL